MEIFEDLGTGKVVGITASCSLKVEDYEYMSKDMEEILKSQVGYKTDGGKKFHQKLIRSNRLSGWVKSPDERKAKKKRNAILHQPRKCK